VTDQTRRTLPQDPAAAAEPDDDPRVPVLRTTAFGAARLLPDVDRRHGWLLTVDGAPQSYVDLADPEHLEFEYVRRLAFAVDAAAPCGLPLDVLHLGGGAMTLPRYVAAVRPGSRQVVVEADGALAELVAEHLPLPAGSGVTVRTADARAAVEAAPAGSADLVVADVFGRDRVPAHLTTVEYLRAAARVLRPGGLYLANLADGAPFAFLRPHLAALAAVFPHVCLLAEPGVLRGRRFGNAVVVAGREELPVAALARRAAADAFPARVAHGDALADFTGAARPVADGAAAGSPAPPAGAFTLR
jgi:spermidine synthase